MFGVLGAYFVVSAFGLRFAGDFACCDSVGACLVRFVVVVVFFWVIFLALLGVWVCG